MLWKNCVNEEIPVNKYHKKIKHMSKLAKMMCKIVGRTLKCFSFHCCLDIIVNFVNC